MSLRACLVRVARSPRTWLLFLGLFVPVGMIAVSATMLLDMRRDAWDKAQTTSDNLVRVIESDIARNFEIIDLSLRAVVDNLTVPGVSEATPELRQLILFDRAASARDMGVMLVLNENGDSVLDSANVPARKTNNADRSYFRAHKANPNLGLHVSEPLISKLTGVRIVVLSRRVNKPDGSFGGVVIGTLNLSYFTTLFERLGLGRDGAINLYRADGIRLVRYPFVDRDIGSNVAGTRNFDRFARESRGRFTGSSVRDGIPRLYAFTKVADWPLILNVALSAREIEAAWRQKATVIAAAVLVLCGSIVVLSFLMARELRRREAMEGAMAKLSLTDALTGLSNRRRFEEELTAAWLRSERSGRPLTLLIVDADHFKRYNDRYGHAVGDEVLVKLAARLASTARPKSDAVCRVGGEEFAVLLPEMDLAEGVDLARQIHAAISDVAVEQAGIEPGAVTVSIGVARADPRRRAPPLPGDLYRAADAALYEAKTAGRNCTRSASTPEDAPDQAVRSQAS